jgi:hypothetical protein
MCTQPATGKINANAHRTPKNGVMCTHQDVYMRAHPDRFREQLYFWSYLMLRQYILLHPGAKTDIAYVLPLYLAKSGINMCAFIHVYVFTQNICLHFYLSDSSIMKYLDVKQQK